MPHRLLPEGLPARHRRVAPDGPADRRDVPRRPLAQGDAGRVRLPPAVARSTTGRSSSRSSRRIVQQAIYVSATPGDYELEKAGGRGRRAGHPPDRPDRSRGRGAAGRDQVDDLLERDPQARRSRRARAGHDADQAHGRGPDRVLHRGRRAGAATCTPTSTRSSASSIIRDLRRGEFDVLVGINLLREGLDIPEVSLVAILDADKEGFLRSARARSSRPSAAPRAT